MRKLGASDKFFYYTSSYRTTFSIRFGMTFCELDIDKFKTAVLQALNCYREYAYKPVIFENRLYAEANYAPVVVATASNRTYHYGTEDTNGYLFYFTYADRTVELTYYHGLTDTACMIGFLRSIVAFYAEQTGFEFSEEERKEMESLVRTEPVPETEWVINPYERYGDAAAVPEFSYSNPAGAFLIPVDYNAESEVLHGYSITLSTSAFIRKTKEFGVSFVPLLNSIVSEAVCTAFDAGDKTVVAMVPADMRSVLQVNTPFNFSDSLLIPFEKCDRELPQAERCAKLRQFMVQQKTENNFRHLAGAKAAAVASFEGDPTPLEESARAKTQPPPADAVRPVTYALTYPGRLSLSSGLDRMLEDMSGELWVRANSVFVYTFRNKMQLQIRCRTDNDLWARTIDQAFHEMGFETELADLGQVTCARMIPEEIEKIR